MMRKRVSRRSNSDTPRYGRHTPCGRLVRVIPGKPAKVEHRGGASRFDVDPVDVVVPEVHVGLFCDGCDRRVAVDELDIRGSLCVVA